ncbi:MAG: acyl-CoA dehydrogenase family protein [Protaetiibacter sp.]
MSSPSLLPAADPAAAPRTSEVLDAAARAAELLRPDVVERDVAGGLPLREVAVLRETGLLAAPVPADAGGGGAGIRDVLGAVRVLARVDGSAASLFGYHAVRVQSIGIAGRATHAAGAEDAVRGRLLADTAREGWYWAGTGSAQEPDFALEPVEGGYRISGGKGFATGAAVADRLVSGGVVTTASGADEGAREVLRFAVDPKRGGVSHLGDWDALGQRRTASGGVALDDYLVRDDDVFGAFTFDPSDAQGGFARDPQATLIVPGFQLLFVNLYLGLAEGAVLEAAEYTRTRSRTWVHAQVDTPVDDPYVLRHYGEAVAQLEAASALARDAVDELAYGLARGAELTFEERSRIATRIAAAKVVSTRAALDVTARVFEATGARATARSTGLDRFWREARTHTLHDPVEYKVRELGEAFLVGRRPEPSHYR